MTSGVFPLACEIIAFRHRHHENLYRPEVPAHLVSGSAVHAGKTELGRRAGGAGIVVGGPEKEIDRSPRSRSQAPEEPPKAPHGSIYRHYAKWTPGPGTYAAEKDLPPQVKGGTFLPIGPKRGILPLTATDLDPGQYEKPIASKDWAGDVKNHEFSSILRPTYRLEADGTLPGYVAAEPRIGCNCPVPPLSASLVDHLPVSTDFKMSTKKTYRTFSSPPKHDLNEYLVSKDSGPRKPAAQCLSKESIERVMRRIQRRPSAPASGRRAMKAYTFSRSERM